MTSSNNRQSWSSFANFSLLETLFYTVVSTAYLTYISYRTWAVSPKIFQTATQSFLENGTEWHFRVATKGIWRRFGQAQDVRDLEWTIFRFLVKEHLHLYFAHMIVSRFLKMFRWSDRARLLVLAIVALLGVSRVVGVAPVIR